MTNPDNVGGLRCPKCHGTLEVLVNQAEPWAASSFAPCPDCHPAAKKNGPSELPEELEESIRNVADWANADGDEVGPETKHAMDVLRSQIRAYGELCRAAPAGGDDWDAAIEAAAKEADHWQSRSGSSHACGQYIAGAIRGLKRDSAPAGGEYPEAAEVCAEAYQVVGCMLMQLGLFDTPEAEKILDNLSEHRLVHKDVLPWTIGPKPLSAPAGSGEVEALVKLWRDRAAREDEDGNPYETQQSEMRLRLCADELEALLRKLQQGAEHG